ncbi:MAG: hypothetical protein IMZ66_03370 [Planctomycetes bacterium]|nr:hypothetical protein [Planctomycetota bacterium]
MKRWLLVIVLGTAAVAVASWQWYQAGEGRRLVARFVDEPGLAPRVVALGPDAVPLVCEKIEALPASGLNEAERRQATSCINVLDALAAGYPYTMAQSVPFLIETIQRMQTEADRALILDAVAGAFEQTGVTPALDALEFEYRQSRPGDPAFLAYKTTVAALLRKMGPDRCLPVLEGRLLTTQGDLRRNLAALVAGFAPDERVDRILARTLETEDDAARRAWLAETIDRLRSGGQAPQAPAAANPPAAPKD